jgi:hypothetical protein
VFQLKVEVIKYGDKSGSRDRRESRDIASRTLATALAMGLSRVTLETEIRQLTNVNIIW